MTPLLVTPAIPAFRGLTAVVAFLSYGMAAHWRVRFVGKPAAPVDIDGMPDLICLEGMNIDIQTLRRLRDERSWTQEHLATVSGLSLRTIQRIEREGNASADSRLALAGAFQIDVSTLSETPAVPPVTAKPVSAIDPDPTAEVRTLKKHAQVFFVCSLVFIGGDLLESGRLTWAWWPIAGWGSGLLLHAAQVLRLVRRSRQGRDLESVRFTGHRTLLEHALLWLVASAVFLFVDWHMHGRLTWAYYPVLGWGLGLLAQYRSARRAA